MKHGKQVDVLIVGIGTDIVEIARVKRAAAREAFLMRVYTEAERAYCESRGVQRMASYAARFAGKEAVMKALGTGLRGGTLHDIEILPDALGAPRVHLSGYFAQLARSRSMSRSPVRSCTAMPIAVKACFMMEGEALRWSGLPVRNTLRSAPSLAR